MILPLITNGTIGWGAYDPASPFYGWGEITTLWTLLCVAIGLYYVALIIGFPEGWLEENLRLDPYHRFILVGWACNFGGYLSAGLWLIHTRQSYDPTGVFLIWFGFLSCSLMAYYRVRGVLRHYIQLNRWWWREG